MAQDDKVLVTVGRQVYYYPTQEERDAGIRQNNREPLSGNVAAVWASDIITLAGNDANGISFAAREIAFINDTPTEDQKEKGGFACWMPYQLGQQKKTEEIINQYAAGNKKTTAEIIEQAQQEAKESEYKRQQKEYRDESKPPLELTKFPTQDVLKNNSESSQ